jgi:transposase
MGKKHIKGERKLSLVQRQQAGEISEEEAARIAGVPISEIKKWIEKYVVEGDSAFLSTKERHYYTPELKRQAVQAYCSGKESMEAVSKKFGIREATVLRNWVMQYKAVGEAAFICDEETVKYSPELKLEATRAYCEGKGSMDDICQKFGIRAKNTLRNWIAQYTVEGNLAFFPNRKKGRYDPEVKLQAVKAYIGGEGSLKEISKRFGLRDSSVLRRWLAQYENEGETAFVAERKKANYTPELKIQAVTAYRSGEGSQQKICRRFGVRGVSQLRVWLAQYEAEGEAAFETEKRREYSPELKLQAVQAYRNGEGNLENIRQRFGIRGICLLREWLTEFDADGESAFCTGRKEGNYSPELKLQAVQSYLGGEGSQLEICRKFGIRRTAVLQQWLANYEVKGEAAFSHYSLALKRQAVQAYCNGEGDIRSICKRFGVRSRNTLRRWIKKYGTNPSGQTEGIAKQETIEYPANSVQGLPIAEESEYDTAHRVYDSSCHSRGESRMSSTQNMTQEEKIQIAEECLQSGKKIKEVAEKHGVTYQQAYRWTQCFKQFGVAGFEDRRGRRKKDQIPRSETEQLRVLVKKLEYEKRLLKEENGLLKKLAEVEGREFYRK